MATRFSLPTRFSVAVLQQQRGHTAFGALARRRERWFYLLITPWLIGFFCFQGGPVLAVLLLAFAEWPLPGSPTFVGFTHFRGIAVDPLFYRTLFNTLYYTVGVVPLGLVLGVSLALLLNVRRFGVAFFRTLFFAPVVISGVALTLLWGWIFNPRFGLLNHLLGLLGINGPAWLQDERWAMPALIVMSLWTVGINMVVYLAALQAIPTALLAAAALDGAGRWARFWHIQRPLLSPVTFYLLIVNVIGAFQVFTPTYVLTRGGPNNATLTLPLYLYFHAFLWSNLGYAAALAIMLLLFVLLLTLLQFGLAQRWVLYQGEPV